MWYQKSYPGFDTWTGYRQQAGYVQVKGHASSYRGVSPSYAKEVAKASGDRLYVASYYTSYIDRGISTSGFSDPWVRNTLHSKLVDQLQDGNSAQLLTSLVEVGESYNMIARRAITLRRAFVALRKFDLPRVAKELALPRDVQRNAEKRVSKKHLVTQNWLEYWMGWAPLVGDIQSTMKVLDSNPRSKPLRVSCRKTIPQIRGGYEINPYWGTIFQRYSNYAIKSRYSYGARIQLVNPQLNLASQLGLTNPLATAWELVPFSFIANWFVNVDQLLQASSPFYGYSVLDGHGTLKSEVHSFMLNSVMEWDGSKWAFRHHKQQYDAVGFFRRPMPIPTPGLVFSLPDRLSLSRAATSISLLTQLFLNPKGN